jgi:hypothetical protein
MPPKKPAAPKAAHGKTGGSAASVAEPPKKTTASTSHTRPTWIDGPPVAPNGEVITEAEQPKNWGDPYKAIVTGDGFELGENRRFKQRVFTFREKPSDAVLAALKDNGFTYRPNEKAWTIPANPDTRKLSDGLARQFAGPAAGKAR